MSTQPNPANVIRGHKAAVASTRVSDEAKEHSLQEIERLSGEGPSSGNPSTEAEGGHTSHVIGGYKATLSNERTSDEAKANAEAKLVELGVKEYTNIGGAGGATTTSTEETEESFGSEEPTNRQLGGYKATLKNPNVSEEAKDRAADRLRAAGVSA